jgi:hypothetical protein
VNVNKNNPYNPKINEPVKNNILVTANLKKTAPVKNYNMGAGNGNVALYAIRNTALGDAESTYLTNTLNDNARQRIELITDARQYASSPAEGAYSVARVGPMSVALRSDSYTPASRSSNPYEAYNPMLPESEYNVRPKDLPVVTDERIERHRNDRPWLLDSEKHDLELKLRNSDERKKRLAAQEAAYDALHKNSRTNRWKYDEKKAYLDVNDSKNFRNAESAHVRVVADPSIPQQRTKVSVAATNEVLQENAPEVSHDNRELVLPQSTPVRVSFEPSKPTLLESITTAVTNFFGLTKSAPLADTLEARETFERRRYDIEDVISSEAFHAMQKSGWDHVKLINNRDWDGPIVVDPVDEYSNIAAGIITYDDELGLKKSVVFKQDGKFIIVQKQQEESVLGGALNRTEDLDVTVIPEEYVDKEFRQHIDLINPLIEHRAQPLNMTYEDYIQMIEWIEQNQDLTERMTARYVIDNVRGFNYERDIMNSYSTDSTVFLETFAKSKMVDDIRTKFQEKVVQRVTPAAAATVLPSDVSSSMNFKTRVDNPYTPRYTTARSKALPKNAF